MTGSVPEAEARSIWSHDRSSDLIPIELETLDRFAVHRRTMRVWVRPQYEQEVRRFFALYVRRGRMFLIAALAIIVGINVAGPLFGEVGFIVMGLLVLVLGVLVYAFPFVTPEAASRVGLAQTIRVTQLVAMFVVLLGIGVVLLGLVNMFVLPLIGS